MTTASHPLRVSGRVVTRAAVAVLVVGLVAAGVTASVASAPQAWGVVTGTLVVAVFFAVGGAMVSAVLRMAPGQAMLLGLMTYALQLLLVFVVFLALDRSGVLGTAVDPVALALSVLGLTVLWTIVAMVTFRRARIPVYDEPRAPQATPAPQASQGAGDGREAGA